MLRNAVPFLCCLYSCRQCTRLTIFLLFAPGRECTSDLCLKFNAWNWKWVVRLKLIGLAYLFDCAIVLLLSLMTLIMLRLFASKLSSACSRFIQKKFLPYLSYLRISDGSSSLFIHVPSFPPSTPSAMLSSLLSSSFDTTRLYFGSIPTFSPLRPGKALWIVWDSHPLFPPAGFVNTASTPVIRIFTSCSWYALSISVGSKWAILRSLFLNCFNCEHVAHTNLSVLTVKALYPRQAVKFYPCQFAQGADTQFRKLLVVILYHAWYRRAHLYVCPPV